MPGKPRCPHHATPESDCVQCRMMMRMRQCICGEWSLGAHCGYCGKPIGEARRMGEASAGVQMGLFATGVSK